MNIYVFDSSALMHLFDYYYESRFPTLWKRFNQFVENGQVVSVREVKNEIFGHHNKERRINKWAKKRKQLNPLEYLSWIFIQAPNLKRPGHLSIVGRFTARQRENTAEGIHINTSNSFIRNLFSNITAVACFSKI